MDSGSLERGQESAFGEFEREFQDSRIFSRAKLASPLPGRRLRTPLGVCSTYRQSQGLGPRREQERGESDKEKLFKARQICLRREGREEEREPAEGDTGESPRNSEGAICQDQSELY